MNGELTKQELSEYEEKLIMESEERLRKEGKLKDTNEFPWRRNAHEIAIERKAKGKCTFDGLLIGCSSEIYGNINPERALICGNCVQKLLQLPETIKTELENLFISRDLPDQVRSIEAFKIPEEDTTIATFKTSSRKAGLNSLQRGVKGVLR